MNFNNEIALPKGIIITGLSGGNRKTELLETILKRSASYEAPLSVTTCSKTAYGKKSDYYLLKTPESFEKMIAEKKLLEYSKLDKTRWFGTLIDQCDLVVRKAKTPVFNLDCKGLSNFYDIYGYEGLKNNFCIVSLMPNMDNRRELIELQKGINQNEMFRRIGFSEMTERKFFMSDEQAVQCIHATTSLISKSTDLGPLADAMIKFSLGITRKVELPKALVSR